MPRFLNPGIGYGGSCFPKDVMAFRSVARENGYEFRLLDEVVRINEDQRHRFLRKVHSALWTLRGKNLGVLGLAFKGGTDDIRESPAIMLVQALLQEGSKVCAYDPAAMERAREVFGSGIAYASSAYEAANNADALLVLTEWEEFRTSTFNACARNSSIQSSLTDAICMILRRWLHKDSLTTASGAQRRIPTVLRQPS